MTRFSYDDKNFLLNGKPFTILSGALHYFRIPREYWYDRLLKLKECGFNTVETYTCWNLHEEREGEFNFSGMLDLAEFIKTAEEIGLYVILRPGPYICAEWEAGGLPAWLFKYHDMALRCNDALFLEKVKRYFVALFNEVRPHFATNSGGIIMVQVENEYGSYGNDKAYLRAIVDIYRECGVDVTLFTSDGSSDWMLGGGTLEDCLCVVNFGSDPVGNFEALNDFRPKQPLMCGEFWCGWFDHWHNEHHTREALDVAAALDELLSQNASVNMYMFHGGTNFGFMNGANYYDEYSPTVTSYDYCSPLSEAGDLTPTYYAVREVIEKHLGKKLPPLTVKNSAKAAYGKLDLTEKAFLLDACDKLTNPVFYPVAKSQEDIGQNVGFTLYSTTVNGPIEGLPLDFEMLHDRAVIYINGKKVGVMERGYRRDEVIPTVKSGESIILDILVENMGRINYGVKTADRKGINGVRFGQQFHYGWKHYPMEMKNLSDIPYEPCDGGVEGSHFLKGVLKIDSEPMDTFIRLDDFCHGFVAVNGFILGRYYTEAGPQKTLYCPAPMLKKGENEIVVFETDGSKSNVIEFTDKPDLG